MLRRGGTYVGYTLGEGTVYVALYTLLHFWSKCRKAVWVIDADSLEDIEEAVVT